MSGATLITSEALVNNQAHAQALEAIGAGAGRASMTQLDQEMRQCPNAATPLSEW